MARDCLYDAPYWYKGFHGRPARAHLRIYGAEPGRLPVVIATELEHNPGTSITNAAELLAQQVWNDANIWGAAYEVSREGFTWIEHHPASSVPPDTNTERGFPEHFSEVTFEIGEDGNLDIRDALGPGDGQRNAWQPLEREAVEMLIGQAFLAVPDERQPGDYQ